MKKYVMYTLIFIALTSLLTCTADLVLTLVLEHPFYLSEITRAYYAAWSGYSALMLAVCLIVVNDDA